MTAQNLANNNYRPSARGSNIPVSDGVSPWSNQVWAILHLEKVSIPMADSIEGRSASLQGKTQMSSSDDLTDAKIEAAEARTDTKIVQLGGKIEMLSATLGAKLDSVNQRLSDHSNPEPYYWNYCIISYITRCFAHCSCYLWRCAFWTRDECS
jgi:hypothetical protein